MQQVKSGDTVKVHYHGRLTDGTTFDTSAGREPLEFEVGGGNLIPGFENGVVGMQVGDKKTINIPLQKDMVHIIRSYCSLFLKANSRRYAT